MYFEKNCEFIRSFLLLSESYFSHYYQKTRGKTKLTKLITIQDTESYNYHSLEGKGICGKRCRLSTFSLNAIFKLKTVAVFSI